VQIGCLHLPLWFFQICRHRYHTKMFVSLIDWKYVYDILDINQRTLIIA
jgi:hypothetical protein